MTLPSLGADVASVVALRTQRIAQDQARRDGAGAVALIEGASPPPVGAHGEGRLVNRYA